jgi:hypothetical protein
MHVNIVFVIDARDTETLCALRSYKLFKLLSRAPGFVSRGSDANGNNTRYYCLVPLLLRPLLI